MTKSADEYNSLREEMLQHQERRIPILSMTLSATIILFGASVEFYNPYLPLLSLILLFSARVQIAQAHYGVQRIASYIRVIHEQDNPELNWETASYRVRKASLEEYKRVWNINPLSPLDGLIFTVSLVALGIALVLSFTANDFVTIKAIVSISVLVIWLVIWVLHSQKLQDLRTMKVDDAETTIWEEFKKSQSKTPEGSSPESHGKSIETSTSFPH